VGRRGSDGIDHRVDKDEQPIELECINGGFYKRKSTTDHPSFGVETGYELLKAIDKAEGKVVTPKHSIGEWGFMADFADLEGNIIALREKPVR